jgi:hypothetical protein
MATVTKPIALDESIHTTEQTPRNIADVLAEELARIAENILPPNAEDIAYDNTESGLTATNVQNAIDEVISSQSEVIADTMADLTENKTATVTDGVADFETIDGSLVKSLVVEIEPNQSGNGTPSPSNIRPISGYTQEDVTVKGKNLCGELIENRCINYQTGGVFSDNNYDITDYVKIENGKNYVIQYATWGAENWYYDTDKTPVRSIGSYSGDIRIITAPFDGYIRCSISKTNANKFMIELGSSATAYEPYKGKTYTTPFNQTVYGGTLDVLTGELTITHGYVDLGSLTWARSSTRDSSKYRFNASHTPLPKPTATNADIPNLYSSNYTAISPSDSYQNVTGATIAANGAIFVYDESLSTATGADFKTAMNGVQLVYELATPTTLSLTPQTVKALVGENHIMASTGDVTECKFSMLINGDDLEMLLS